MSMAKIILWCTFLFYVSPLPRTLSSLHSKFTMEHSWTLQSLSLLPKQMSVIVQVQKAVDVTRPRYSLMMEKQCYYTIVSSYKYFLRNYFLLINKQTVSYQKNS